MKKLIRSILPLFLLVILYLLFWPVSLQPTSWISPNNPGYEGVFANNNLLAATDIKHLSCKQCEDVAIDEQGRIYGASADGQILRYDSDNTDPVTVINTGGRPLGLDFDSLGNLYIADAQKGLLRLDVSGKLEVLSTENNGKPYLFTDDLEVGTDGKIYFSDASDTYGIKEYKLDILAHKPDGRLLVYDPQTDVVELLLDQLYFANGIAAATDSSFVLVNETSQYRVTKYHLKGDKKGQSEVFIEHLPAFPDGISRGSDGIFWLALISPRNPIIDKLSERPFVRKMIARLPDFLQPAPERHVAVLGLDKNGKIIYNFQDPEGKFSQISSIQQWGNDLYFGSLGESGIGVLKDFKSLK